jgi:hypothetical protein
MRAVPIRECDISRATGPHQDLTRVANSLRGALEDAGIKLATVVQSRRARQVRQNSAAVLALPLADRESVKLSRSDQHGSRARAGAAW